MKNLILFIFAASFTLTAQAQDYIYATEKKAKRQSDAVSMYWNEVDTTIISGYFMHHRLDMLDYIDSSSQHLGLGHYGHLALAWLVESNPQLAIENKNAKGF